MPVAARVIANPFEYVPHSSYTAGKPGSVVLQSVNIASMVGCIHQIALLADYATEIFENLQNSTSVIHDRICDITQRTGVLNNQIPEVNRAVLERNVSTLVSGTKKSEVSPATQMLTPLTRPRQISLCYETMNKIPKVDEMDQYLTVEELETKGKCSNLYSNPLFFFNEWVRVENARQQLIQEEKEKKKREKQERKALMKKEREKRRATIKPEKKKGLNWRDRYLNSSSTSNVSQGNDTTKKSPVIVHEEPEEEFRPSRRTMLNEIWDKAGDNDEDEKPDEQEPADAAPQRPSGPAFAPPPPPPSFAPNVPPPSMPPSLPPSMPPSLPPSMPPSLPPSAPPALPPLPPPPGPPPSLPPPLAPPPPMPPAGAPPVPPPSVPPPPPSQMPNILSSAPPTPNSSEAFLSTTSTVEIDDLPPPPPRRPNPFGAESDRGNLLTSITQGKKLRAVEPPEAQEKAPKKPSLLDEISKGKNLKKVNLEEAALKKQESKPVEKGLLASTGDAVANILARRKFIEESESDSDDSNDEDWS